MFRLLFGAIAALMLAPSVSVAETTSLSIADAEASTLIIAKRSKPRIPGGSGCDDPEDLLEHPECSLKAAEPMTLARSKPRVPGGSGCDDPGDLAEHPECGGTANPPPNGDQSGSGRSKPRIPGGSGCDDPEDILEHPECSEG